MNFTKTSTLARGKFKCFQCRTVVNSKDGAWHEQSDKQIFLCKTCGNAPASTG